MTGNVNIGNGEFSELFTCSHCEQASKVVYGWWNEKTLTSGVLLVAYWFQRKTKIITHYSSRPKNCNYQNDQQLQHWRPSQCFSTQSVACIVVHGPRQSVDWANIYIDSTSPPAVPSKGPWTSESGYRRMKKSCMIRRITFSGPTHRRALANTPYSNGNPDSWMHKLWERSLWRLYYRVGNDLLSTLGSIIPIEQSRKSIRNLNIVVYRVR